MKTHLLIFKIFAVLFFLLFAGASVGYWITAYWPFLFMAGVSGLSVTMPVMAIIDTKKAVKERDL